MRCVWPRDAPVAAGTGRRSSSRLPAGSEAQTGSPSPRKLSRRAWAGTALRAWHRPCLRLTWRLHRANFHVFTLTGDDDDDDDDLEVAGEGRRTRRGRQSARRAEEGETEYACRLAGSLPPPRGAAGAWDACVTDGDEGGRGRGGSGEPAGARSDGADVGDAGVGSFFGREGVVRLL
eukprot:1711052-Rhodomonas_salina.1